VKTDVEELSPTRVRLNVEVPFADLKPSIDKAYRDVARQVRIPGFRPGRVPPRVIDSRVGRSAVITQAFNDALQGLYDQAVRESEILPLGQPAVELTRLDDGEEIVFTAEVEVRPSFELPDVSTLSITVDNAVVTPDDTEEYLNSLRERFASLKSVQRPAETGDYASIDLSASINGEPVEDAQASGVSYEVGSGSVLEGLDDVLAGMSAGESQTFTSELAGGDAAGEEADVTVTVHSVKVKELPGLDDDFAQLASEFDTLGELRAHTRHQLEQVRGMQQAAQARERALETLLDAVDVPLPDGLVTHEVQHTRENVEQQLQQANLTLDEYLEAQGQTARDFEAEIEQQARRSVKTALVLDQVARENEIQVTEDDLTYFITDQARRVGVQPQQYARQLSDSGQIGSAVGEVLRGKALAWVTEQIKVTDQAGNPVDVDAVLAAAREALTGEPADAVSEGAGAEGAGAEGAGAVSDGALDADEDDLDEDLDDDDDDVADDDDDVADDDEGDLDDEDVDDEGDLDEDEDDEDDLDDDEDDDEDVDDEDDLDDEDNVDEDDDEDDEGDGDDDEETDA
jgi:trigger factor